MTDECLNISEYIFSYSNNTINEEDNIILIKHLAICPECRKELALVLSLSQVILERSNDLPEEIRKNVFAMISEVENSGSASSLDDLKSSLVIIKDVLSTTKKSIRLAMQFI